MSKLDKEPKIKSETVFPYDFFSQLWSIADNCNLKKNDINFDIKDDFSFIHRKFEDEYMHEDRLIIKYKGKEIKTFFIEEDDKQKLKTNNSLSKNEKFLNVINTKVLGSVFNYLDGIMDSCKFIKKEK